MHPPMAAEVTLTQHMGTFKLCQRNRGLAQGQAGAGCCHRGVVGNDA